MSTSSNPRITSEILTLSNQIKEVIDEEKGLIQQLQAAMSCSFANAYPSPQEINFYKDVMGHLLSLLKTRQDKNEALNQLAGILQAEDFDTFERFKEMV